MPEPVRDTVNTLTQVIRDYRQVADVKPSTRDEERLFDLVRDLVDQAVEQPGRFRLHGVTARRITRRGARCSLSGGPVFAAPIHW